MNAVHAVGYIKHVFKIMFMKYVYGDSKACCCLFGLCTKLMSGDWKSFFNQQTDFLFSLTTFAIVASSLSLLSDGIFSSSDTKWDKSDEFDGSHSSLDSEVCIF